MKKCKTTGLILLKLRPLEGELHLGRLTNPKSKSSRLESRSVSGREPSGSKQSITRSCRGCEVKSKAFVITQNHLSCA